MCTHFHSVPKHSATVYLFYSVLEIRNAAANDYGTYVCTATLANSSFDIVINATVSITRDSAPCQLTARKALVIALERDDAVLQCKATGQPRAKIVWFRNGNLTVPSKRVKITEVGRFLWPNGSQLPCLRPEIASSKTNRTHYEKLNHCAGRKAPAQSAINKSLYSVHAQDGTLTIKNVSRYDGGVYTCKPSLDNGFSRLANENSEAEVQLRVDCKLASWSKSISTAILSNSST